MYMHVLVVWSLLHTCTCSFISLQHLFSTDKIISNQSRVISAIIGWSKRRYPYRYHGLYFGECMPGKSTMQTQLLTFQTSEQVKSTLHLLRESLFNTTRGKDEGIETQTLKSQQPLTSSPLVVEKIQTPPPRKIEDVVSVLLENLQGSWRHYCVNNFFVFFPGHMNHWVTNFPAVMSHVCLALQEHKLNFQQWSSALLISCFEAISLIFDRAMTYLSGLLVSL